MILTKSNLGRIFKQIKSKSFNQLEKEIKVNDTLFGKIPNLLCLKFRRNNFVLTNYPVNEGISNVSLTSFY